MLDAVTWAAATSYDPRRNAGPEITDQDDYSVGAHLLFAGLGYVPTLPANTPGLRVAWEGGPLGDSVKPSTDLGYTAVIPIGADNRRTARIAIVPFRGIPFGLRAPEDVEELVSREVFFVGISESQIVAEPDVEGTGEYLVAVELGVLYLRRDLAEVIHAITSWHVDDISGGPNLTARGQLSYSAFLAFSARMHDPRYRQVHTVWTQPDETVGQFIERCMKGSDAQAFWGGYDSAGDPVYAFGLVAARAGEELPYTLEVTEEDPGRTAWIIGDLRVTWSDIDVVNNIRRVMGPLIKQETTFAAAVVGGGIVGVKTELVNEALDDDLNVVQFVDAASATLYGDAALDETFDTLADSRSATGDFRIGTVSLPSPILAFGQGPLILDYFCGERLRLNAPAEGIDDTVSWMVEEQTVDFNTFTGSTIARRVTDVQPSLDPDDLDDVILWLRADDGVLSVLDDVVTWSGQVNDVFAAAGVLEAGPKITGASLNGSPTVRFAPGSLYGDLQVVQSPSTGLIDSVEEKSLLVFALVRMVTDNNLPIPLFSTQGAAHTNPYAYNAGSSVYDVRQVADSIDDLTLEVGVDSIQWKERANRADIYSLQPAPPTAVTETLDTATRTAGFGLPVGEWRIVVVELVKTANSRASTGTTTAYQEEQDQSFVAVYDPVDGALENASHDEFYSFGGRAHALDRSITIGIRFDEAWAGTHDAMDLAELAVFARPTTQLPWTPEQIEGLVHGIRSRWGFV